MTTRWDKWFADDNLSQDKRILAAPPSQCAQKAVVEFLRRGKNRILDLACGVGRDSFYLQGCGLSITGVDASWNGLKAARRNKFSPGVSPSFVNADARHLPFCEGSFEGVYCFGLLHEFTSEQRENDVARVIAEIRRMLPGGGVLVLAVLAGDPEQGMPAVRIFSRQMLEQAMVGWRPVEIISFDDTGCTNRNDYHIWYGLFEK